MRLVVAVLTLLLGSTAIDVGAQPPRVDVGPQHDGRVVVPTNQVLTPAGKQVLVAGRPTDLALSPDGRWLAVTSYRDVRILDAASGRTVTTAKISGASYKGLLFTTDGRGLYVSTIPGKRTEKAGGSVAHFGVGSDGALTRVGEIKFGAADEREQTRALSADETYAFGTKHLPAGMAWSADGNELLIALNLANQLVVVDRRNDRIIRRIPVGNAPYDVAVIGAKAYVANFAGRVPKDGDAVGPSGIGRPVRVDAARNIASEGSVSVVDWQKGRVLDEIVIGPHASAMAATKDGKHVAITCGNDDLVWVLDTTAERIVERISVRPSKDLLFGTAPNALAFSADGKRLFVACGTNNAIAVIDFEPGNSQVLGFIPVGWYPSAVVVDPQRNRLVVSNVKGIGSREHESWEGKRLVRDKKVFGYNSHDYLGSVSLVPMPDVTEIEQHTASVLANNRLTGAISALAPPRREVPRRPIPERHGEPSSFKHVVYIIKENRTYDQVFGDVSRGEGDPSLCIYGREVTPNHHKIAEEFVLLDNFYCSGVLSADGHQWAMEAYVTDYLERAFGGFPRSYPFDGGDALAYASSGFLWDNALARRKTLRVYGEFVKANIGWKDELRRGKPGFLDCYHDYLAGGHEIAIRGTATIKTLEPHLCPTYIGFPGTVSDQYRATEFIKELKQYERRGEFPNLAIMLLPNDHTAGTRPGMPAPEAAVADNDLALGRIIEAISHSRFWPETCIFVVQDDPQNGFDHVDGHRTVAMVVSPYTRRRSIDSTNYNQTSMVRTIELILGLPPMNQLDASAIPMSACFTDIADPTPYDPVPNRIPLDRMNPELSAIRDPRQLRWAQASLEEPLDEIDEADEDTLNRILWFAARGDDDTFPAWAVLEDDDDGDDAD
jgi:DNA-binding beta-propeller fold protein YncE